MAWTNPVADLLPQPGNTLFVNGCWEPTASGATFDVDDPSTGETLFAVSDGTTEDATDPEMTRRVLTLYLPSEH